MGALLFLSPEDAPEREKERCPRCDDSGARSGGGSDLDMLWTGL
jgi:hypothetical protein